MSETPDRALAVLTVRRWARYRRAWHNLSPEERRAETARLARLKEDWARDGMPMATDDAGPTEDHCLAAKVVFASAVPNVQEAYLSVETLGRLCGFTHWGYLAAYAGMPWSWWSSGFKAGPARTECFGLIVLLSRRLVPGQVQR